MLLLRSSLFYIGYWLLILGYGLVCLPLFLLPKKIGARFIWSWNVCVLWWLKLCCNIRVQLIGNERSLPANCVLVSNHQSPWETFYFQKLFFPLSTVLKKELLRIPLFGWGLRLLEPMAIDRGSPMQALKQIREVSLQHLRAGKKILLFPEGTRIPYGKLGDYKRGAADIAQKAKVPLIPLAHNGGKYWPGKKFIKYPGTITVVVGEQIDLADKNTKELMQTIQQWTEDQIQHMC